MTMLKETSRTFYIPINSLDLGLKEAVTSAYLCMRAIDEIEDHDDLDDPLKIELLIGVHKAFQSPNPMAEIQTLLSPHKAVLPAVTMQLDEWAQLCPTSGAPIVFHYIAKMSLDMADWVQNGWNIHTEEDLDRYTYSVAGMVGEMLSELWQWHDGTTSDRTKAIGFGRGLQAVNILRNRGEDLKRGVDFFPNGWGMKEMQQYTRRNLQLADAYIADLKEGPALKFCKVPLALAHATVNLIAVGGNKLTRDAVLKIVSRVSG
ncbi:phytoene/squalene synthase family protein [Paenibacillus chondroitinus]|uniref:Phytoene/squalene synthase family protein n=1 Tax=Paenibacillus chondroitinus TaxID=59842 RepID=A0ABU6DFF4_9BACL|nr:MULTISPECIES: phytoene/squalene synthase family protein [Paenibacillus]MCY9659212.1 phytoene/squalene synthase family protein [Paenibacillus anseongense]MEB4796453.1 phytoene/squalene synthase family protein [Paenibacillus chondroitinus]